ncbi:MAG: DUF1573 domain-containing protein [Catalinimonas sp.]
MRAYLRFFLLPLVSLLFVLTSARAQYPVMEVDRTVHDFGEVLEEKGPRTARFNVTNTGTGPLYIISVEENCTCMKVTFPRGEIKPRERGTIEVTFDPARRRGRFNQPLLVTTTANPTLQIFQVRGEIVPRVKTLEETFPDRVGDLRFYSQTLNVGRIDKQEVTTSMFPVYNAGSAAVSLADSVGEADVSFTLEPRSLVPNDTGMLTLRFRPEPDLDYGYFRRSVYLPLVGGARLPLQMIGSVEDAPRALTAAEAAREPRLELNSATYDVGKVAMGTTTTATYTLKNTGGRPLMVNEVRPACECLKVINPPKEIAAGREHTLTANFNTDKRNGQQQHTIVLYTNDPAQPTRRLVLKGRVE